MDQSLQKLRLVPRRHRAQPGDRQAFCILLLDPAWHSQTDPPQWGAILIERPIEQRLESLEQCLSRGSVIEILVVLEDQPPAQIGQAKANSVAVDVSNQNT